MNIRQLTIQDFPIWKNIRLLSLIESPSSFGVSYEEEINESISDWESRLNKTQIFGAFMDDVLVGTAGFFVLEMIKIKHRGRLVSMYILPQYRGKGIANELVKAIINHAESRVLQINLNCNTNNLIAINLYEKHGFKICGTEPRSLKIGDEFFDEHMMTLEFKSC